MADVISSSTKEQGNLMIDLKQMVNEINHKYEGRLISPLTITLGDEFQGIPDDLDVALAIIFSLEHLLLKTNFRLRYVINHGKIETPINREIAYEMLGEGLTQARKQLNGLKKDKARIKTYGLDSDRQEKQINWALRLCQSIYDDWKPKDKEVAYALICDNNYSKVAGLFGKDPSSMWRKRESLKIEEYEIAKSLIQSIAA